jgi:hypothetical protein
MAMLAGSIVLRNGQAGSVTRLHAAAIHIERAATVRGWRRAEAKLRVLDGWGEFMRLDYSSPGIKMV